MAHGVSEVLGEGSSVKMVHQKQQQQQRSVHQQQQQQHQQQQQQQQTARKSVGVMGSRRIFAPAFKLKVLDSYRNDIDCRGNQRATARKYGIHRRQIQKWLQCEDNLRNSCAESGNTGSVSTSIVPSTGVSNSDDTVTEATGSAVTPAAPALNLSLARLHGDELATRQGPPPLLPHPPHGGSPSSPQYGSQATAASVLPLRVASVGYQDYSANQEQRHLRRETEERIGLAEIHGYPEARLDRDSNCYVLGSEETSPSFDGRNEVKVYQTLTSYRPSRQDRQDRSEHSYDDNEITRSAVCPSPIERRRSRQNYGDADSSIEGKPYGLLLAPSMIKTERASPDSAATPGPCEPTGSPGASRVPLSPLSPMSPLSHRPVAVAVAVAVAVGSGSLGTVATAASATSVHSGSPGAPSSPCAHVHLHRYQQQREHARSTPDSEKPILSPSGSPIASPGSRHLRRESRETATEETAEDADLDRAVVKEESHPEEEEIVVSSCPDYQRPPAAASSSPSGSSFVGSPPVSPSHHRDGYSLPPSPRGTAGCSERSGSSCSESEMDPLDCSSGSHASSNDLARRRSFSLKFKLDVLDAFHRDVGVAGNQRATARKFGINRRQVQKWLGQETELRGEIALRGNSRQRLGPIQDVASGESPVDLRTTSHASILPQDRSEVVEYQRSPPPALYCCDVGSSSSQHRLPYYRHPASMDPSVDPPEPTGPCNLSCCLDGRAPSAISCYQEVPLRGSCYGEPRERLYCYSPRDYPEIPVVSEPSEEISPLKRRHCGLSCCYEPPSPSPKRLCLDADEVARTTSCPEAVPPQETPLCLVKPKTTSDGLIGSPSRLEPVTSTVPTPPVSGGLLPPGPTSKKDAILFKPYLDNPVSKPAKEYSIQRGLSPVSSQNIANNNNCQGICNLNEGRGHDYALELSLRLPVVSWRTHASPYTEFPQVRSAFVRYPTSPRYT